MRLQRPSKQPQRFASTLAQSMISVHMVPAVLGLLFAFATQAWA
jgi:hypothetical protein